MPRERWPGVSEIRQQAARSIAAQLAALKAGPQTPAALRQIRRLARLLAAVKPR